MSNQQDQNQGIGYDPAMFDADYLVYFGTPYPEPADTIIFPSASGASNMEVSARQEGENLNESQFSENWQQQDGPFIGGFQSNDGVQQRATSNPISELAGPSTTKYWASNTAIAPVPIDPALIDPVLIEPAPIAGLQFANGIKAEQAFSRRQIPSSWQPPVKDATIPQNQADREKYIAQMVAAIVDTRSCHDSDTNESYQERWAEIAQGRSTYTSQNIETVCWKLLSVAEKLHQHGPEILRVFDENKLHTIHKSRNLDFAQRILFICDLMRLSKSRCEILLGLDNLEMTVGAPAQMLYMAKTNKKTNLKRQEYLLEGRTALQDHDEGKKATKRDSNSVDKGVTDESDYAQLMPQFDFGGMRGPAYPKVEAYRAPAYPRISTDQANARVFSSQKSVSNGYQQSIDMVDQPSGNRKRKYETYDESDDSEAQAWPNKRTH